MRRQSTNAGNSPLAAQLSRELEGEVLFDAFSRGRYSTDASMYQIQPIGVVVPRGEQDIVRAIRKHKPSAVITQDPTRRWMGNYINHPDHRNTGDATMDAVFPSARDVHMFPELQLNEGLGPHIVSHLYLGDRTDGADVAFDISRTIDLKIEALCAHVSQVPDPASTGKFVRKGAADLGKSHGFAHAESFKYFFLGKS